MLRGQNKHILEIRMWMKSAHRGEERLDIEIDTDGETDGFRWTHNNELIIVVTLPAFPPSAGADPVLG